MRTLLSFFIIMIVLVSCDNQAKTNKEQAQNMANEKVEPVNNYVVVWKILTEDYDYVMNYLPEQAEEFDVLFNNGTLENAYLNNYEYVKMNNDAALATVIFFVKAESVIDAQAIIDQMSFVRNNVATYNIYPVGGKWLGRNVSAIENPTFSFASIWFNTADETTIKTHVKTQSDQVVELWNEGKIENAYFATENAFEKKNEIPGMIFFVNAETEEEAREICDGLVFTQEGISDYQLYPVGTFWMSSSK